MTQLKVLQQSFMGKMLGSETSFDVITSIQSTPDTSAAQRLSIYATGYRLRLKEALMTDYERLHSYLGDELFEKLMDAYINRYPSKFTSLSDYSQYMGLLLNDLDPYSNIPELLEIESIERAFNQSFHSANDYCVEAAALAEISLDNWPSMQLGFHSSITLLKATHNSFPIWKALSEEHTPPALEADDTSWIVWRKDLVSRYRPVPMAELDALQIMMQEGNFAELCEALLKYYDEQQTPTQAVMLLQTWIGEQMICSIDCT